MRWRNGEDTFRNLRREFFLELKEIVGPLSPIQLRDLRISTLCASRKSTHTHTTPEGGRSRGSTVPWYRRRASRTANASNWSSPPRDVTFEEQESVDIESTAEEAAFEGTVEAPAALKEAAMKEAAVGQSAVSKSVRVPAASASACVLQGTTPKTPAGAVSDVRNVPWGRRRVSPTANSGRSPERRDDTHLEQGMVDHVAEDIWCNDDPILDDEQECHQHIHLLSSKGCSTTWPITFGSMITSSSAQLEGQWLGSSALNQNIGSGVLEQQQASAEAN